MDRNYFLLVLCCLFISNCGLPYSDGLVLYRASEKSLIIKSVEGDWIVDKEALKKADLESNGGSIIVLHANNKFNASNLPFEDFEGKISIMDKAYGSWDIVFDDGWRLELVIKVDGFNVGRRFDLWSYSNMSLDAISYSFQSFDSGRRIYWKRSEVDFDL